MLPALLFAALLSPAAAQDARLEAAHGAVSIRAGGAKAWVEAQAGNELLAGDSVRTGPRATAHVVFPGGAVVLLGASSRMTIGGTVDKVVVDVRLGEFLIGLARKLTRGQSFSVRVPAAVAAVRGTLFWGKTGADKTAVFAGFGHRIEVKAKGKKVLVKAGQSVSIKNGEPPGKPQRHDIPRSYLDNFAIADSLQGLEKLVEPLESPLPPSLPGFQK